MIRLKKGFLAENGPRDEEGCDIKRVKALFLMVSMIFVMGTTALAAEENITTGLGEHAIDVKAKYDEKVTSPAVYSVDIVWGEMEFTYVVGGINQWNPNTHEYQENITHEWIAKGNTVTISNHSNDDITALFSFHNKNEYDSISGSFSTEKIVLPSAVGKALDSIELTKSVKLILSGSINNSITNFVNVGAISIAIN